MNAVTLPTYGGNYGKPPMKFTLIYDGPLPAGGNKRAEYSAKVRNYLHPQLYDLWESHVLLRQLTHEARANTHALFDLAVQAKPPILPEYKDPPPQLENNQIDLTAPISAKGNLFKPIVRDSLYLSCAIDLLFLRYEEPLHLFTQGGDIDNRLKCFFDGLKIPDLDQAERGEDPCASPLCCLLENDRLIADFSVRSGRLLGRDFKHQYDVRIQADITIKVLRVFAANMALVGG